MLHCVGNALTACYNVSATTSLPGIFRTESRLSHVCLICKKFDFYCILKVIMFELIEAEIQHIKVVD